jgi:hypothetical protein
MRACILILAVLTENCCCCGEGQCRNIQFRMLDSALERLLVGTVGKCKTWSWHCFGQVCRAGIDGLIDNNFLCDERRSKSYRRSCKTEIAIYVLQRRML